MMHLRASSWTAMLHSYPSPAVPAGTVGYECHGSTEQYHTLAPLAEGERDGTARCGDRHCLSESEEQ